MNAVQLGANAGVNSENVLVDDSTYRETVKSVHKGVPNAFVVIVLHTLLIESKTRRYDEKREQRSGDKPAFVIATEEKDAVWIAHLQRKQEDDVLDLRMTRRGSGDGIGAAIHVITQKEIVRVRNGSGNVKEFN